MQARLDDVRAAARGTQNLLDPMKEALRANATLGEVSDALRDVFGVYRPVGGCVTEPAAATVTKPVSRQRRGG